MMKVDYHADKSARNDGSIFFKQDLGVVVGLCVILKIYG